MKRILLILVLFSTTIVLSQEKTFEKEVNKISKRIERITKNQKDSLKVKVIEIDKRLAKGEISKTTATTLKKEVAAYHARRIEILVGEQERLLQLLVQDKTNGKIASSEEFETDDDTNTFTIGNKTFRFKVDEEKENEREQKRKERWKTKNKKSRSTTSQFVFAMGVNNVLNDNDLSSLDNSEYQFWRSRFYELGFTWKTRFSKEPSQLYFKYGVSFLWNNLRLEDNRIHVKNGDITEIQTFNNQLSESRLRHVQMNFPLHLEWDLSKNKTYKDGFKRDRTNESVRLGVGGFVGFKLGTRQYLEYKDANNVDVKEVQKDNFNMNTINYGVSAYLGYRSTSFYVKYDLNPLFQNTETRNISMGIRLDLD
ncbi:hypothetical protein H9W90_07340 [Polaribacter pectinis]|uniref:Outer membrane protein beta-barrel domain-containing protein n=1 Tax=Polaribacter pectinis TaxID=2738844 RepID=A0A7G9LE67_9FLAO|nr:hypothetical protein [Polaribacter pectinis]QNM86916.1 hypothetical protein H9W90_07340 [Polaribacter pectinis]